MIPFVQGSTCRGAWTPDAEQLYKSLLTMPSFTYTGNNDGQYEAIEEVGFPGLGEDIEIWENSAQFLDGLTIDPAFPELLWTFLNPLDQDFSSCTLAAESDTTILTNSFVQPASNGPITAYNVEEAASVRFDSDFAHSTSADGEHRGTIFITHTADWEPVHSGVAQGYVSERFTLRSELQWWEIDNLQSYWQGTNLHSLVTTSTGDNTTGTYFRRTNSSAPLTYVRDIPWGHGSTLPSLTVVRRLS